ncbi:efflux RND transporter periplasmic adaptor subunit [Pseudoalteromonas tunicata]|nr:efflux RND transporter periplasmic adaptor subunit [Pseudoalteromonas tunicata]AXT32678.1 efflux RND transporter periplasmic adaptor subunit [Pseudoalteromonas tunicata]MDP4983726.1 efflux RND transporter periplasmic adaptor subunit [Pseudoalteromonas tunicata]MDP5214304.1 efflux RND transporter periplasmic adaptor subunit [Pseudoalteromonas tunicata]
MKVLTQLCLISVLSFSAALGAAEIPPVPVSVSSVKITPLSSSVMIHGTVFGRNDVNLTAGANGQLTYVVEPGQQVREGEVIAKIDMLPLQLQRAEQEALIKRAKINLKYHQQELARLMSLAKTDSTAAFAVDQTQNQHDLALSDIELAQLKLKQLDDHIARATVKAPFGGVISQRFRQVGSDVNRADELVTLLDTQNLEVRLFVPVKYLKYLANGQELSIKTSAFDGELSAQANITAVIPATDARSQTFEVRALITQTAQSRWASGQLVEVDVPLVKNEAVSLVDRDALILRKQGVHVVKIDAQNKAHHIAVSVGKGQGQWVEVATIDPKQALQLGDKVAVRGAERLTEGQAVEVQQSPI